MDLAGLVQLVKNHLSDDLLAPGHRPGAHCYVASEVIYHFLGGRSAGLTPMNIKHEGVQHWFLLCGKGMVIDVTADQFDTPVPYDQARGRGFLTKKPSKRAQILLERIRYAETG
jgi:hypothetical protein